MAGYTIRDAEFIVSNTSVAKCPAADRPEFAFIGRSNVGKSSLINMLTVRKGLAKTSATPEKRSSSTTSWSTTPGTWSICRGTVTRAHRNPRKPDGIR